jgi:hypothetical protein
MSSSPAGTAEITIPAARIIKELTKSAQPGFYGPVEVHIGLSANAIKGVEIVVVRHRNLRSSDQPTRMSATEKETDRERSVQKTVGDIASQLRLRLSTVKIVGNFIDGTCNSCEVVDEERVV